MYDITNKNNGNNLMESFNDFVSEFVSKDMKTNIEDNGNEYILTCDVAGYNKEDINIEFIDNQLTIKVNNDKNKDLEKKNYIVRERRTSSITRRFVFNDADANSIKAKVNDGILTITLGKLKKEDKNKYITIE